MGVIKTKFLANHFPFIEKLSIKCQQELGQYSRLVVKPKGEVLLRLGDFVSGAYLVVEGELSVFTISEDGRETILYSITSGESCLFALNSLFSEIAYPAWVRVETKECKIVLINGEFFKDSFTLEKPLQEWAWEVQSTRVMDLMCSIDEILNLSVVMRLKNYLIRSQDESGKVRKTHDAIGKSLGVSREAVTRNLKMLSESNVVQLGRGCITLVE